MAATGRCRCTVPQRVRLRHRKHARRRQHAPDAAALRRISCPLGLRSTWPARTATRIRSCPPAIWPAHPKTPSIPPAASTLATRPPGHDPRRTCGRDHVVARNVDAVAHGARLRCHRDRAHRPSDGKPVAGRWFRPYVLPSSASPAAPSSCAPRHQWRVRPYPNRRRAGSKGASKFMITWSADHRSRRRTRRPWTQRGRYRLDAAPRLGSKLLSRPRNRTELRIREAGDLSSVAPLRPAGGGPDPTPSPNIVFLREAPTWRRGGSPPRASSPVPPTQSVVDGSGPSRLWAASGEPPNKLTASSPSTHAAAAAPTS
jgi:hypothetical protein